MRVRLKEPRREQGNMREKLATVPHQLDLQLPLPPKILHGTHSFI